MATLADEVGPRRPTSRAERLAAEVLRDTLNAAGVANRVEAVPAYASFGYPYGALAALALASTLLPRRARLARTALAGAAAGLLAGESGLVHTPLSALLARTESRNVVAFVEPREAPARTLCLTAHIDSSRSGLLFHPAVAPHLRGLLQLQGLATAVAAIEPLLPDGRLTAAVRRCVRTMSAASLALIAERELRGEDVAGANDNASGVATVVELAAAYAAEPLASTRLAVLLTGAEEAGLLGMQAYLRENDTSGWLFLNVDGVAAPATLRYLPAEGVGRTWPADPKLVALCEQLRSRRPELGLEPADAPLGLTYDATAVLARGGRALTLAAGDAGRIPNYHQPTDTTANADVGTLERAAECARELIAAVDRGEADR
jgi:hypothetical protein